MAPSCLDLGGFRDTVDPGEVSGDVGVAAGERGPAVKGFLFGRAG